MGRNSRRVDLNVRSCAGRRCSLRWNEVRQDAEVRSGQRAPPLSDDGNGQIQHQ